MPKSWGIVVLVVLTVWLCMMSSFSVASLSIEVVIVNAVGKLNVLVSRLLARLLIGTSF